MRNLDNAFITLSQESQATNVQSGREDEIVVYAKIGDFEGLKQAQSKESHEQWQVSAPFGKIRVRKTTKEGLESTYSMAIKTRDSQTGVNGGSETEMDIDQTTFDSFKTISQKGMIKDRYVFPTSKITLRSDSGKKNVQVPDLKFEVDVYPDGKGGYHEWCKIDLEINSLMQAVKEIDASVDTAKLKVSVTDLPFKPADAIESGTDNQEQKDLISQLYDKYFLAVRTNTPQSVEETKAATVVDGVADTETGVDVSVVPEMQEPEQVPAPTEEVVEQVINAEEPSKLQEPEEVKTDEAPTKPAEAAVEPVDASADVVTPESQEVTTPVDNIETIDSNVTDEISGSDSTEEQTVTTTGSKVKLITDAPSNIYGKTIEGTQSGYIVSYEFDGKTYEIEIGTSIRGSDIPVTITYSGDGTPSVIIK